MQWLILGGLLTVFSGAFFAGYLVNYKPDKKKKKNYQEPPVSPKPKIRKRYAQPGRY